MCSGDDYSAWNARKRIFQLRFAALGEAELAAGDEAADGAVAAAAAGRARASKRRRELCEAELALCALVFSAFPKARACGGGCARAVVVVASIGVS